MMRTLRHTIPVLLALVIAVSPAIAQERDTAEPRVSPNAATSFQLGITQIDVTYGAPSVRERTIFGGLVPFDEVWRTGANEATTITFSTDVRVEGHPIEAGSYMLATVPGEDMWTIILNDQAGQWGTYSYDSDRDVLRVDVTPRSAPSRETMALTFDNVATSDDVHSVELVIHWDEIAVPVRLAVEAE